MCVEYSPVQARSGLLERWNLAVAVLLGYGMRSKFPGREGRLYVPKYGEGSGVRLLLSCLAAMQAGGIVQERELWMSRSSFFLVRSAVVLVELRIDRE